MTISPEERKVLDFRLSDLMDQSQRSLVALRKGDFHNLSLDVEQLAISIQAFKTEAGVE